MTDEGESVEIFYFMKGEVNEWRKIAGESCLAGKSCRKFLRSNEYAPLRI